MKRVLFIFTPLFLVFSILFCTVTPSVAMSESISEKVFRLHILANSNSEKDQALKLEVRDGILSLSESLYADCHSVNEAKETTRKHLKELQNAAKEIIEKEGFCYTVSLSLGKAFFNTRYYDGFTLPAGNYECLRIVIGEGQGHNWWCVMFPQVCLSACTEDFDPYLTKEEKELLTSGGWRVRFKAVEIIEKIKQHRASPRE